MLGPLFPQPSSKLHLFESTGMDASQLRRLKELENEKEVQEKTSKPFQGNIERSFKT